MGLPDDLRLPAVSRLDPTHPYHEEILRRHESALAAGAVGYLDPESGYLVFTAAYLWDRGTCCDTGCRHCPYVLPRIEQT